MADEEIKEGEEEIEEPETVLNFPDPSTATDEEILAFGWQFFFSYIDKLAEDVEKFRFKLELLANNSGEKVPEKLMVTLRLQTMLMLVLTRFVKLETEEGEENANSN